MKTTSIMRGVKATMFGSVLATISAGTAAAACPVIRSDGHNIDLRCNASDQRQGYLHCMKGSTNCDNSGCYGDADAQFVCVPEEPVTEVDSIVPRFIIVTVAYAPPGSKDCARKSTATYGEDNKLGVTVKASNSVKQGTKVTASVGAETPAANGEASVSFSYGGSESRNEDMVITKTEHSAITIESACEDGVNYNWDQIYMLLSPEIAIQTSSAQGCASCGESMSWGVVPNTGTPFRAYVGELNGAFAMQPATVSSFQAHGITADDINAMLNADPAASTGWLEGERFVRVGATFPYLPVIQGGSDAGGDYGMTEAEDLTTGFESSYEYGVGFSVSGGTGIGPLLKAKLAVEASWTWTNTNSTSFANSRSTSASVHIASPSAEYQGPYAIAVYYDTIYKTYVFVPTN